MDESTELAEVVYDGEVVSDLETEARARAARIRERVTETRLLLLEARLKRDWETLGYGGWEEYVTDQFRMSPRHARRLMTPPEESLPKSQPKALPRGKAQPKASEDSADNVSDGSFHAQRDLAPPYTANELGVIVAQLGQHSPGWGSRVPRESLVRLLTSVLRETNLSTREDGVRRSLKVEGAVPARLPEQEGGLPNDAECQHPKDQVRQTTYGTWCDACDRRVR